MSTGPTFTAGPSPSGSASSPALRPLSVGEIIDVALKLFGRNFGTLVKIVLFVVVPIELLDLVVRLLTVPSTASVIDGKILFPDTGSRDAYVIANLALLVLRAIIGLLATGALFRALSEAYLGHGGVDWKASLRFGLSRIGPLLWLSILFAIGLVFAFIALVLPGIWLSVAWCVAVPALMVEDYRGSKALGRSFGLVQGNWWRTFGTLLLFVVVIFVVSFVLGLVLGLVFSSVSSVFGLVLGNTLVNVITSLIVSPLQAAVLAVLYFDLRVRKEGLDLQLLTDRLGLGGSSTVGPAGAPAPASAPAPTASTPPPSSERPDIGL